MVQTSIPVGRSTRKTALLNSSNNSPYAITFSVKWFGVLCCIIEKTKIEKYKRREKPGSKLPNLIFFNHMNFQIVKIYGFYKIILGEPGFIMSFKICNCGVKPEWLA